MLPILLFPVAVPVVIATVRASAGILSGAEWGFIAGPVNLVVVYDIILFAIAIMTFDYLMEE
jgi:heme exporter protein B